MHFLYRLTFTAILSPISCLPLIRTSLCIPGLCACALKVATVHGYHTPPIQLSTTDPSESRKPDSVSAQQNIVSLVDPISTKHERFESTIKNLEHSAADLKAARRRISLGSGKADQAENDSQGSPSVPHYMAPTESAKAKSRPLRSTTASPDLQENSSAAKRRISLPDSHGKQNSGSPHTQRSLSQALTTTKGNRVLSPRDATEKKIQTEWRR